MNAGGWCVSNRTKFWSHGYCFQDRKSVHKRSISWSCTINRTRQWEWAHVTKLTAVTLLLDIPNAECMVFGETHHFTTCHALLLTITSSILQHLEQHMGKASIRCEEQCSCELTVVDAHHEVRNSVIVMEKIAVSSNGVGSCTLVVTTLQVGLRIICKPVSNSKVTFFAACMYYNSLPTHQLHKGG